MFHHFDLPAALNHDFASLEMVALPGWPIFRLCLAIDHCPINLISPLRHVSCGVAHTCTNVSLAVVDQTVCVGSQQPFLTLQDRKGCHEMDDLNPVPIGSSRLAGRTSGSTSSRPCSRAATEREGWGIVAWMFNPIHSIFVMPPLRHQVDFTCRY